MTINIPIENIADAINHMDQKELETLTLLLSAEKEELLKRKTEIENGTVETLSHEDVFDV